LTIFKQKHDADSLAGTVLVQGAAVGLFDNWADKKVDRVSNKLFLINQSDT